MLLRVKAADRSMKDVELVRLQRERASERERERE